MATPRIIHVFMASPGNLAIERRTFKDVIDELNKGFGDGAGVKFVALGWEDTLATTGRRSQAVINLDVDRCEVFVLALYGRWGQEAPDAKPYTSYTEEEFHRALDRWKKTGVPEVFVFFKQLTPREMGDPGEQLKKVLAFKRSLEQSRQILYRGFADGEFRGEVDRHLRAYAKGELSRADAPREGVVLPVEYIREVELAKAEARQAAERAEREQKSAEAAIARADQLALELAERAAKAALDGRIEEATQTFAMAQQATTNPQVLYLAAEFYDRTGNLTNAEQMLEQSLAIGGRDAITGPTARALNKLGVIYQQRGELERAEEMYVKALAIDEKLGTQEGIASAYSNLGLIHEERGELDRAEEMQIKALAISEKLGSQKAVAIVYNHLGGIYLGRRELDRAEEMYGKALAISEKLGSQDDIAVAYGNLGGVHVTRGELDRAEQMYTQALAIHEKLGRQEAIATGYGNFGLIHRDRGELHDAEKFTLKSLAIFEKLGHQVGIAYQYRNLSFIYEKRGELDRAENMLTKALAIYERLGAKRESADECWNLGLLHEQRANMELARELVTKARDLYAKVALQEGVTRTQMWLDSSTKAPPETPEPV